MPQYQYESRLKPVSRELRHGETDAEKKLGDHLKDRRLEGLKFRRQFPIGEYVLDFYCIEKKLAIEVDGGQHAEDIEIQLDEVRTKFLNGKGVKVLRFWNNDVIQNEEAVLEVSIKSLQEMQQPHPALSSQERGT